MTEKISNIFYPPIEPYNKGFLEVSNIHKIYYEEVGNPNGVPVVFLHGGPGVGIYSDYRRFFDPEYYRVILFDQRGCGQSLPLGCLEDNNTDELVNDIEKLRDLFNIDNWIVFGGSWGSTLALIYAIRHKERVKALVLRGIFLAREKDINWLFEDDGAGKIFPDYFSEYKNYIPENERGNLVEAYYKRLTCEDKSINNEAGRIFSNWETKISKLNYKNKNEDFTERDLANSKIEALYMIMKCFIPENYILDNLIKIIDIKTYIVHGRYDIVCSTSNAWDLEQYWIKASSGEYKPKLVITPNSGHSQMELENINELVGFMEDLKQI
ncbi:MAG: prolyl aminopeptidase [Candidatus Sericytochromatia bacterium]